MDDNIGMMQEQLKEQIHELLDDKPEYLSALVKILNHEEDIPEDDRGWTWKDVGVRAQRLNHLVTKDVIKVTYDSSSKTRYRLREDVDLEGILKEYRTPDEKNDTFDYKIPDNIFDVIVGYEEIKKRFRRSLESRSVRQSILLVGPRASAKSVFLDEVRRIEGTKQISGGSVSPAGFENAVMERPNFIIIDEFDEVDGDVYSVLLNYQDPKMDFTITKAGKNATITPEQKAPIFASANRVKRISEPNLDRFWRFFFRKYKEDEFEKICVNILPRDYELNADVARYIAETLYDLPTDTSVRDAERIAEVCRSKDEVDDEVKVMRQYSK